ncbi:hypothetical protein AAG906_040354 [Vitis piasezkii]
MKGGRAWFRVDSKSFKISVGFFKGKVSKVITERRWRFWTCIRFGESGLSLLLQGVEFCIQKRDRKVFSNSWVEGERSFKLQLHSNEAGRFLLCSVFTAQERRSCGVMSPHGMVEESSGEAPHSKRAESMGDKVPASYAEVTKGPRKAKKGDVSIVGGLAGGGGVAPVGFSGKKLIWVGNEIAELIEDCHVAAEETTFEGVLVDVASFSPRLGLGSGLEATFKSLSTSFMGDWALMVLQIAQKKPFAHKGFMALILLGFFVLQLNSLCWRSRTDFRYDDMVKGGCELSLVEVDGSNMDLQAIGGSMEVVFRTGEEECLASERDLDVSKDNFKRLLTFRKKGNGLRQELKKSVMPGSKSERELCKLKYSVNYKSTLGIGMRTGPLNVNLLSEELGKENFWNELGDIRGLWNDLWCTGGLNNGSTSRLNHFLVAKDYENHFSRMRTRKIHFCFENMWLKVDNFKELIRGWWEGCLEMFLPRRLLHYLNLEVAIKEGVANAFQSTFSIRDLRPPISGLDFAFVSSLETQALEVPFIEKEVFAALSCLNGDKTPGPDGFSMAFWQACWDVVKKKVMGFFYDSKEWGTEDLKDFRPVSLVGSLYKPLAKVIAIRLKIVVGNLVSIFQHAFMAGRQILDAVLIANEAIGSRMKANLRWVIWCKEGSLPSIYLRLPLGAHFKSFRVWDGNTLSSLPIYFMSLFVIPRRVAARLEKIQRDFFVGKRCLRIEATLDVWVSDLWDDGGWGLRFTRQLHDWELEEVQAFLGRLSAHPYLWRPMCFLC